MAPFTSIHHIQTGKSTESNTLAGRGGLGWMSRAFLLSLSCCLANCTDSTPSSSPNGVGGANTSTGGAKNSDGSASGGADNNSASTRAPANGGASTEDESGGTTSSASAVTSAPKGGAGNKTNAPNGGTATSSGASSSGGAAVTGGASNETQPNKGGAATGGKSGKGSSSTATGGKSSIASTADTGGKSSSGGTTGTGGSTASGTFTLTSPGWTAMAGCGPDAKTSCAPLPTEITRTGAGTSPELHWSGAPEGTKSFVVVLQDLNNSTAHWILWNIPASVTALAANVDRSTATPAVPAGSQQCGKGTEAATSDGYYGPGAPCNVYEFVVYALSVEKFSPTKPTDQESVRTQLQALGSSILGTASLRGRTNQSC
ncbi:MAG TPA: hypothetical protein VKP30_27345 [Polyangiaceae bacterium]|nr:hypothetical protein [Polyangiaceae bacterium]